MEKTKITLADNFIALANTMGDETAIVSGDLILTFGQLAERCAQTARQLTECGVRPGDNVGITMRDNAEFLVTIIATWMADAVAVPLDFRTRGPEREKIFAEFDLATIVEDRPIANASYPSIRADHEFHAKRANQSGAPLPTTGPDVPAYISLTSGTTGTPIGFVTTHAGLLGKTERQPLSNLAGTNGANLGQLTALSVLPMSFSAVRNHNVARLLHGGTVVFFPPMHSPQELLEGLLRYRAGFCFMVPTMVRGLLELARKTDSQPLLPDMKLLYIGGSNLQAEEKLEVQRKITPNMMTCYASTASGTVAILHGEDVRIRPETEGRILKNCRVEIVDENDEPVPAGEKGIIRTRSAGMASHIYANRQRAIGDKIRGGWAYPGDLGSIDGDGFLSILGRQADLIVRGGVNIYPAEVEAAIQELDGVREVAVIGYATEREGDEIAAFVTCDSTIGVAEIEAHCRRVLTSDKRPRTIRILDRMPLNTNGKILKQELLAALDQ